MKTKRFRSIYGWVAIVILVSVVLELTGAVAMRLSSSGASWWGETSTNYSAIRAMLQGDKTVSRYISQPYLTYIPNPGYSYAGFVQHNNSGYRGREIPEAPSGKYRILCLGGSTTYGSGVPNPDDSYPAQLDKILQGWHSSRELVLSPNGVEVINAGVEAATSAEELAYYLYKFRYYRPDLVIINSGGNDALVNPLAPNYVPDYTHFRRQWFHIQPLPKHSRWLLHSRFLSFAIIGLFYADTFDVNSFFSMEEKDGQRFAAWSDHHLDSLYLKEDYTYYPFYRNHRTLVNMGRMDGCKVIDVAFGLNLNDTVYDDAYRQRVALHNRLSEKVASEESVAYIPFSFDSISQASFWLDDCHLNEQGEHEKALMVARKIRQINQPPITSGK